MSKTILTGLRSNDDLHLGNYLGAIKPMVELQINLGKEDRLFMFIPDLHSFTTPIDHSTFYEKSLKNVRMFVAAGLNPDNSQTVLYRQSKIPAHSEMALILQNFTYFGETNRMTEFKDKSLRLGNKAVSVGLFTYPILMAADILLYDADYVPIGDDQKQHMELTRSIAERMNNKFGEIFNVPASWDEQLKFSNRDNSIRIMSLSHPENKMSKSADDPKGTINLTDKPAKAGKKIHSATTDNIGEINFDRKKQAGISNLLQILALLSNTHLENLAKKWQGRKSYGELKSAVADATIKFLTEFQAKYQDVDTQKIEQWLSKGEEKAGKIAASKLQVVQKALGLIV